MDNAFDDSKLCECIRLWLELMEIGAGLCYDRTEDCVCLREGGVEREGEKMNKRIYCSYSCSFASQKTET